MIRLFITFEGTEGSGKSSQIGALAEYLRQMGYNVLTTREPGGTPIGEQVRAVISNLDNTAMHPRTEILLFQASRAQLVEQVIRPHLSSGGLVLSDRYADSTLAYQGYGYQTDLVKLKTLVDFATGGLKPDLTDLFRPGCGRRAAPARRRRRVEPPGRPRPGFLPARAREGMTGSCRPTPGAG